MFTRLLLAAMASVLTGPVLAQNDIAIPHYDVDGGCYEEATADINNWLAAQEASRGLRRASAQEATEKAAEYKHWGKICIFNEQQAYNT